MAAVTNATSIPVALVTDGLVKTLFALRFRLKLGYATFRCGLHSAKRAVPPSAALPLANIQTEAHFHSKSRDLEREYIVQLARRLPTVALRLLCGEAFPRYQCDCLCSTCKWVLLYFDG